MGENVGLRLGSLVAGLGLGSMALAMASQEVLKDIVGPVTMLFDRPFDVDDVVVIGKNKIGRVAAIGPQRTRCETFDGETLLVPNRDINKTLVANYGATPLSCRRILIEFSLSPETSAEALEEVPELVHQVLAETRYGGAKYCEYQGALAIHALPRLAQ